MKTVCIGENLVDTYISPEGETAVPGGAPLNVACYLASMGLESYIITSVSKDVYGEKILSVMDKYGVRKDMTEVSSLPSSRAVVTINKTGDRSFKFEKAGTAGFTFDPENIEERKLENTALVHFCSVSLFDKKMRKSTEKVIRILKDGGALVSYDLNIRYGLFDSEIEQKTVVKKFLQYADIIKLTDEELKFITGLENAEEALKVLFMSALNAKVVFLTLGEDGSYAYSRSLEKIYFPAEKIEAVDTTGAGDMFISSCIKYVLDNGFSSDISGYKECLKKATVNCAGICIKKGALSLEDK